VVGSQHVRTALYTLNDYQHDAMRTAASGASDVVDLAVLALGLAGESGEVAELVKKQIGHGHGLTRGQITAKLGDALWYLAVLANAYGVSLSDVAHGNVDKLRARYPGGFTHEASRNRLEEE